MKFHWGWGAAALYCGFGILIGTLVYKSNHQRFDLVSDDYYGEELAFQKVIDGSKNQSSLSSPIAIHANETSVFIDFPGEFKDKAIQGDVLFYCAGNSDWDHTYKIGAQGLTMQVDRKDLHKTRYTIKIKCNVDGKSYYQESDIPLL
jgi:FixH